MTTIKLRLPADTHLTIAEFMSALQQNPQQSVQIKNNHVTRSVMHFLDADSLQPRTLRECRYFDNIIILCDDGSVDILFDDEKFILTQDDKSKQLDKYTFILSTTDIVEPKVIKKNIAQTIIKKVFQPFSFK